MIKETDILIGAGPAGCMAAYNFADNYNVTGIESKQLPRNKPCSGVLIGKTSDILTVYFGEIPEQVKCSPNQTAGLNIINEKGKILEFPETGINIVRDKFDYWLTKKIIGKGAKVITGVRVIKYQNTLEGFLSTVKVNYTEAEINSKIIIACDGINGTSRKLSGAEKQEKVFTFQRFYKGTANIDYSKFYAFTSPLYSQYDAWINSKNGYIIIGTIADNMLNANKFLQCFIDYLERQYSLKIECEAYRESWSMPFVFPDFNILYRFGGMFFAGEVAGFLNPFGEGISIALKSGNAIADACIKNLQKGRVDYLEKEKDYQYNMQDELSRMKRQWRCLENITPAFFQNVSNHRKRK